MKNFMVGSKVYAVDNSYSWNKTKDTPSEVRLAGDAFTEPLLVEVVSEPYLEEANSKSRVVLTEEQMWFVDVKYNGNIYKVLNDLQCNFDPIDHCGIID